MQKKCILVYFVKSGPQNAPDSNKIIIIFIKKIEDYCPLFYHNEVSTPIGNSSLYHIGYFVSRSVGIISKSIILSRLQ